MIKYSVTSIGKANTSIKIYNNIFKDFYATGLQKIY